MEQFTEKFDKYICTGDTIETEINGINYTARIEHDDYHHIDEDDCHSEDQTVTGCNDEQFKKLLSARKAWFNNEWFYCGVVISARKNGVLIDDYITSLWGIECNYPGSDNGYLTEIANELIDEAKEEAEKQVIEIIAKLAA